MLNDRTVELIEVSADGAASPEESAELQEILASSEEARTALQKATELVARLDQQPAVEAPAFLKRDVLARLQPRETSRFGAPSHRIRRQHLGVAWAATALLVTGVAIVGSRDSAPNRPVLPEQAAGALASEPEVAGSDSAAWPPVSPTLSTNIGDGTITVVTRKKGERVALEILFSRMTPVPLTIRWDSRYLAVSDAPSVSGTRPFSAVGNGEAVLEATGTSRRLLLFKMLRVAEGRTDLTIIHSGSKILSTSIPLN